MKVEPLRYQTSLSIPACIAALTATPWEYGDALAPMWYDCDAVTEDSLLLTLRGGKFRKAMRTRYRVSFSPTADGTIATLEFQDELFGLPPMTPIQDLDQLLMQKLYASRISAAQPG